MSLPASESSTHVHSNTSSADRFTDYARRITSLLCGSVDVNGGRTVADWERFLRSSENSLLSTSYQQRISAARERFLLSQQEVLDEMISEGNREGVNASDIRRTEHLLKGIKHARNTSLDPVSEIESTTAYSSASAPVSVADSLLATASVSASSATRSSSMSAESSVVNSQLTSLGSCSSVHVNSSTDETQSSGREGSVHENDSRQMCDNSESHTSESRASTEMGAVSANTSDHKHHLNWFRNPWHAETRGGASSVSAIGTTAQSQHSEEVSDVSQPNDQFNNEEDYTLLHMPRSLLERHIRFDATPSDSENATESEDLSETEAPTEYQSTVEDRNESASASGGFPDYGRGSPDGLSTGHTVGSSSRSVTSEDILIVDEPEDDSEAQGAPDSPSPEGVVLLHLEQQGESRPPSEVSLPSTVSLESHNQSWFSDSPEDEVMEDRLDEIDERILGMLPAGYRQSDDNLFGQRQTDREEFLNELRGQLTEHESEWMRTHHPVPQPLTEEPDLPAGSSPFLVTTANVISALECPVCFTYMRSPIWLCVNGHNICGRCQQRILTCPVCRGRLLFTRNLALEAISGDLSFKTQESDASKSDKDATSEQGDSGEVIADVASADTNAEVCTNTNTNTNRFFSGEIEHLYAELVTWLGIRPTIAAASHDTNTNVEVQNEQSVTLDTSRSKHSSSN